jgi:hypothetical protein
MYQVKRLQLTAQTRVRKPLIAILKSGLRPTQQCRTIVTANAATEKKEDAINCEEHQYEYSLDLTTFALENKNYQHKSPRRLPVIVRQVPHEEAHNAAHDQTREKLETSQEMERHARVMRWRGLRATVEWLEHVGRDCVVFATGVEDCGGGERARFEQLDVSSRILSATVYAAGKELLTSVRALSAERVRLEQDGKMME